MPVTLAELLFGVTHEGAADVDDLLDRRTRIGLVPADRELAVPAAERALQMRAPTGRLNTGNLLFPREVLRGKRQFHWLTSEIGTPVR